MLYKRLLGFSIILIIALILGLSNVYAQSRVVSDYITSVSEGDWKKAQSYWLESVIEQSRKSGIFFDNVGAKYDCASLIMNRLDDIRSGQVRVIVGAPIDHTDYQVVKVTLAYNVNSEYYDYYVVPSFGEWKIADRAYIFARSWPVVSTKYVDIHVGDSSLVNKYALAELDAFIEQASKTIGLTDDKMALLKTNRLQYYLCSEKQMEILTGFKAEGMNDLAMDYIFSQHLPHKHELIHFLINFRLGKLPLYTLPILQEGTAVALGGRWGKTAEVVNQLGNTLIDNEFVQIDDIIQYDDFYNKVGSAEIAYPAAGLFVDYIISEYGIGNLLKLYRLYSGSVATLSSRKADDFKLNAVPNVLEISYDDLLEKFDSYRSKYADTGILPGWTSNSGSQYMKFSENGGELIINQSDQYYLFKYSGQVNRPIRILFDDTNSQPESTYNSWMFAEHDPGDIYDGYRFGLVFDAAEAGLYDYYLNLLESKYVLGFVPDSNYVSSDGSTVTFRLDKNQLPGTIEDYKITVKSD